MTVVKVFIRDFMQARPLSKIRPTSPQIFRKIAQMIRASSIMTPRYEFEYCQPDDLLTQKLSIMENKSFDVLPMLEGDDLATGRLCYYVEQETMKRKKDQGYKYCEEAATKIDNDDLLRKDSHMEDVISVFSTRGNKLKIPLFLVDSANRIIGLVTLADLDKTAAKMYFFAMICELELSLLKIISGHYKKLRENCSCEYCRRKRKERSRRRFSGNTLEEYHYLNLRELLHIIVESKNVCLAHERIKSVLALDECDDIARLRNSIAHPKPLVEGKFPLDRLVKVHNLIKDLVFIVKNDAYRQPQ